MADYRENVIEFYNSDEYALVTLNRGRYISKVLKYAEQFPGECKILAKNTDGSILAKLPAKWVRIAKPKSMELTDEERKELGERLAEAKRKKGGVE